MIFCDGVDCKHRSFHLSCLSLQQTPRSDRWFCPDCAKKEKERPFWVYTPDAPAAASPCTGGFSADWRERGSSIWAPGRKPAKKARGAFEFKHPEVTAKLLKQQGIAYVGPIFMGRNEKTAGLKDPPAESEPKVKCPFCKKRPCNQSKTMICILRHKVTTFFSFSIQHYTGHSGGIRCYLDAEGDANFQRAFIRPYSKVARAVLEEMGSDVGGAVAVGLEME